MDRAAALDRYVRWMTRIHPDTLAELHQLGAPHMVFRDPFVEVHGPQAVVDLFARMFKTLKGVRFEVHDRALGTDNAFLAWTFHCKLRPLGPKLAIEGVSRIGFDGEGRVTRHIDDWDASQQLYAKVPVLGPAFRRVQARWVAG